MAHHNVSLDTLIVKATNPLVENPDPLDVASFCEKVTHEIDGPQIAVKLLAYRIHSPQEKEALNALALLEQCVKSCGPAFQSEIGKFRFLNELIKLVSPKYQAHRTPNQIKQRILDIMYTWTIDLKSEPKIHEAYEMLRKQGVIKDTPKYLGTNDLKTHSPVRPRERAPVFDNSEKDALLQKLLKSKNPEDLQAANRLIKSMVREEENRVEAASRRQLEMETVTSNIRLLQELLDNCETNGATPEDMELCKELAANCDRLRPNLSKLATETDDKGDALAEILQISDDLSQVLDRYHEIAQNPPAPAPQVSGAALDLLDLGPVMQPSLSPRSALDDPLLSFGLDDTAPVSPGINLLQPLRAEPTVNGSLPRTPDVPKVQSEVQTRPRGLEDLDILGEALLKQNLPSKPISSFQRPPEKVPLNVLAQKKAMEEMAQVKEAQSNLNPVASFGIDAQTSASAMSSTAPSIPIDFDLLMAATLPKTPSAVAQPVVVPSQPAVVEKHSVESDVCMLEHGGGGTSSAESSIAGNNDDVQLLHSPPPTGSSSNNDSASSPSTVGAPTLADILLKIEDIKPSSKTPMSLLVQESGLSVKLLSASAQVPKNVSVFVVTVTSCHSSPLANFTFQAIVPKGNRVKLLPPSDNKLPAFNPFLPPPAITQIMLLSTPGLNLIELKFVVSFDMDGETITEMGSIQELPLQH